MLKLTTFLTIAMLGIVPLTGCQQAQDAADQAQDTATEAADQAKDTAGSAVDQAKDTADGAVDQAKGLGASLTGFNDMKDGVTETIASVQAGDFAKAKTDFTKVQDSWGSISEGMKDNKNYSAINEGVTNVKASLDSENPDSGAVVGQLQGLLKNLGEAVKG